MILAAIDPHRDDDGAAALGALLARVTGAPLLLASAYAADPARPRSRTQTVQTLEWVRASVLQHAGRSVDVSTTAVADDGSPAGAIHRLATRRGATLIVVGSSARGTVGRMLPGAVTDRLLHAAPCPVAVATAGFSEREASKGLELIGAAFVDRPDGRAALVHACDLARAAGARVRVLTVRERADWALAGPLGGARVAAVERTELDAAERTLRAGVDAIPGSCAAGGEVLSGPAGDALAAASTDLDLLVCGARGHGPVRTTLLGGVSHALVREAACPVLVVPLA